MRVHVHVGLLHAASKKGGGEGGEEYIRKEGYTLFLALFCTCKDWLHLEPQEKGGKLILWIHISTPTFGALCPLYGKLYIYRYSQGERGDARPI